MPTSLDAAIDELERCRPGWGWSVSNYIHSGADHCTCFLHYPHGGGCTHADGPTPAAAVHAAIALTDDSHQIARAKLKAEEREKEERLELARLIAKYPDAALPSPSSQPME